MRFIIPNYEVQSLDISIKMMTIYSGHIKVYIYQKTNKKVKTNDVINLYNTDKEIHDYINETAHLLGKKLKDILELLNNVHILLNLYLQILLIHHLKNSY